MDNRHPVSEVWDPESGQAFGAVQDLVPLSLLPQLFRISGHRGHGRWEVWVHCSTRAYGVCLRVELPVQAGFGAFLPPGFEPWCDEEGPPPWLGPRFPRGEWPSGGSDPRPLGGSLGFPGNCEGIRMCPGAASDTAMALARPAIISQGYLLRVEDSLVRTCG